MRSKKKKDREIFAVVLGDFPETGSASRAGPRGKAAVVAFETPACLQGMRDPALSLWLLRVLFCEVGFASMDFLSAINLQLAVLVFGVLVLLVVTVVLVNLALRRDW